MAKAASKKDTRPKAEEERGLKLPVPNFLNKTAAAGGDKEKDKGKPEVKEEKKVEKHDASVETTATVETKKSERKYNFVFSALLWCLGPHRHLVLLPRCFSHF